MNKNTYLANQNEMIGENSFMKTLLKKRLNQKGLTLIELLAVIVILAIVAAIAVPAIGNVIENSRYDAVKSDATNVLSAANLYFTEQSSETTADISDLKGAGYLDNAGKLEDSGVTVTITKASGGHTILTSAITYSGSKTITFGDSATSTGATQTQINSDDQKGSDAGNKSIPE